MSACVARACLVCVRDRYSTLRKVDRARAKERDGGETRPPPTAEKGNSAETKLRHGNIRNCRTHRVIDRLEGGRVLGSGGMSVVGHATGDGRRCRPQTGNLQRKRETRGLVCCIVVSQSGHLCACMPSEYMHVHWPKSGKPKVPIVYMACLLYNILEVSGRH